MNYNRMINIVKLEKLTIFKNLSSIIIKLLSSNKMNTRIDVLFMF